MIKYLVACLGLATLTFSACKENTVLSPDLIPAIDNINTFFTDTISLVGRNIISDSIVTSHNKELNYLKGIGCVTNDPVFGKSVASLALQLRTPKLKLSFPGTGKIGDSLVLSIPFVSTFGDTSATAVEQTFAVHRMTTVMDTATKYYNTNPVAFDPTIIGLTTIRLSKMDSVTVDSVKLAPQLRIKLSAALIDSLLFQLRDSVEYLNLTTFNNWFKGLYIRPVDTNIGSNIGYFDVSKAKMTLYSRAVLDATSGKLVRQFTDYYFDPSVNNNYMVLDRNFVSGNPLIKPYINTGNPSGDSLLFLQGNYGACIELDLANLKNFANKQTKNFAINKAEFDLRIAPSGYPISDSTFRIVPSIFAVGVDSNSKEFEFTKDNAGNGIAIVGGAREFIYENGLFVTRYRLNLIRTLQEAVATKNFNFKIRLKGRNVRYGAGRNIFYGFNSSTRYSKFNLIYTII